MVTTTEAESSGTGGGGDTTGTTLSKLRQTLSSGLMTAQETGELAHFARAKQLQTPPPFSYNAFRSTRALSNPRFNLITQQP